MARGAPDVTEDERRAAAAPPEEAPPPGADAPLAGGRSPGRRELLLAWLVGLLVAALPVRAGLLHPGTVFSAVDTASVHLPWSAAAGLAPDAAPANPALADQGRQFYPFYRWVSRSWRRADPPTWNPLIYAGAPGIGNAQSGALDPQVLFLVALDALGGTHLFDRGFAFAAWLRYALALVGAYALARRLGLGRAPATLCAVGFGFSGYETLWLNHALGHVPPFLPWTLYFVEGLRDPRARARLRAAALAALSLGGAVLGGHAETAFYVGCAAGLWCLGLLRTDRRAASQGLAALALGSALGAASLLPLAEYLGLSAAQLVRSQAAEKSRVDLLALGAVLAVVALGAVLVGRLSRPTAPAPARGDPAPPHGGDRSGGARVADRVPLLVRGGTGGRAEGAVPRASWLPAALGVALAAFGAALLLRRHGLGPHASLALVPDRLGSPGTGGYHGESNYIELASAWLAFPVLAFALAAALSPARGGLPRRRLVLLVAGVAFLLSIEVPGLLGLYRFVPLVGLGATVRLASVGALFVSLLAAEGLQRATAPSRWAAGLTLVPLLALSLVTPAPPPLDPGVARAPQEDVGLGFVQRPADVLAGDDSRLEGWVAAEPAVGAASLAVVRVDEHGETVAGGGAWRIPLQLYERPSDAARGSSPGRIAVAPAGARWFRADLPTSQLSDGLWLFTVELLFPDKDVEARRVGIVQVRREVQRRPLTLLFLVAGLLALLLVRGPRTAWLVVLLAGAQALDFARGVNPAVPEDVVFPPTRTEAVLADELGPFRFFPDAGVMPANTGMVRGLRDVEGYDAMDPASFDQYTLSFLPDANPVLSWNPRNVDLDHPAFRLLGVNLLVLSEPIRRPGWDLIAGPGAPRQAETWIYRARDPVPRAFCVGRVVGQNELGELARRDPSAFDPERIAGLAEDWRPARPFRSATVGTPTWTNSTVRVHAELDGDGLLVLTDQHFPGWRVYVDGERRPLLRADWIFRGVALGPGAHEVEFRYEPRSVLLGAWISAAALAGVLGLLVASAFANER